jgi:hypothetical protein
MKEHIRTVSSIDESIRGIRSYLSHITPICHSGQPLQDYSDQQLSSAKWNLNGADGSLLRADNSAVASVDNSLEADVLSQYPDSSGETRDLSAWPRDFFRI